MIQPDDIRCEPAESQQMTFEEFLLDISTRFINLPVEEIDGVIENTQERVCERFGPLDFFLGAVKIAVENVRAGNPKRLRQMPATRFPKPLRLDNQATTPCLFYEYSEVKDTTRALECSNDRF